MLGMLLVVVIMAMLLGGTLHGLASYRRHGRVESKLDELQEPPSSSRPNARLFPEWLVRKGLQRINDVAFETHPGRPRRLREDARRNCRTRPSRTTMAMAWSTSIEQMRGIRKEVVTISEVASTDNPIHPPTLVNDQDARGVSDLINIITDEIANASHHATKLVRALSCLSSPASWPVSVMAGCCVFFIAGSRSRFANWSKA